ncbi:MAG: HlyD family efflux transporter periplasmic adaptor subunit [Saprospiraceae bacterium]|nr:HlyD family efflux transporter periplasmic adaptor subunit [Saprospiraceae bacterium]
MLNISENTITDNVNIGAYKAFGKMDLAGSHRLFTHWLLLALGVFILFNFLPWTQNIQAEGQLTTLRPEQRPQFIPSAIAGRIEKWYVQEGQLVRKGDTIVFISEIKAEYFDPLLVERTDRQVTAKEGSIRAYTDKVEALEDQMAAMRSELAFKQRQLNNKIEQARFKIAADSADLTQALLQDSVAIIQYQRAQNLFEQGLEPRSKVEDRRVKLQETAAKVISARNKLDAARNDLSITQLDLSTVQYEYNQKIAKAESERFSALSAMYDTEAGVNKLRIESANYRQRTSFYYILAPQDCYITKAMTPGIGETVKEGDPIVSIVPADYQLAVELYIQPMDLPLVHPGQVVRFIFDGWPAFIFSGWPGQSFGTYSGEVVAIDNMISNNGKYRILVTPDDDDKPWPRELRAGSGAKGIALLNNVPLWYEVWRQFNGFPPDFYKTGQEKEEEQIKRKAPAKSLK